MIMTIWAGIATLAAGLITAFICFANGMRSSPGEFVGRDLIAIAWMVVVLMWLAATAPAYAQEHNGHRPQDMALHNQFYRTWMMPDNRAISCCHEEDCRPAEAHMENGRWYARQDGDNGDFTPIPPEKVEQDRDSPDGRSHLCGRRYGYDGSRFSVFCFLPASGS